MYRMFGLFPWLDRQPDGPTAESRGKDPAAAAAEPRFFRKVRLFMMILSSGRFSILPGNGSRISGPLARNPAEQEEHEGPVLPLPNFYRLLDRRAVSLSDSERVSD